MKAVYKRAAPYADDAMNLPVKDVDAAIPYYERTFGFRVVARHDAPHKSVVLARDNIQIGLAENGGALHRKAVSLKSTTSRLHSKRLKASRRLIVILASTNSETHQCGFSLK